MADSLVLRNGGDYVLRNGGDRILRNPGIEVTAGTDISISHVTLDAGIDLRRKDNRRQTEVLQLSIEIPFTTKTYRKEKLLIPFECVTKTTDKLTIPLKLIRGNNTIEIPFSVTAYAKQKIVVPFTGQKKYSKALLRSNEDKKTMMKIDTLKELLRELDEE